LEKLKRRIQEGKYEDKEKATREENQLLFKKYSLMRILCFETEKQIIF
jgi:hypothetical protein